MNCPKCQSENTQTYRIAYASGTSSGTGYISGGYSTNTSSQTPLAELCAPPIKKTAGWLIVLLGIFLAYTLASVVGIPFKSGTITFAFFIGFLFAIKFGYSKTIGAKNSSTYNDAFDYWSKRWICLKCGTSFLEDN
jgi:hypothetical protein